MATANMEKTLWDQIYLDEVWPLYPPRNGVRQGKTDAALAWAKHKVKTREQADKIIGAINYLKTTPDWNKDNGKFIPCAKTFLNPVKKKWEIEFDSPVEEQVAKDVGAVTEPEPKSHVVQDKAGNKMTVTSSVGAAKTNKQLFLERLGYDI